MRRQPEPEADQRGRDRVGEVVEVVAVARALGAPHARERAVQRVAEPVHDEQRRRDQKCPVAAATANATAAASASTVR